MDFLIDASLIWRFRYLLAQTLITRKLKRFSPFEPPDLDCLEVEELQRSDVYETSPSDS